MKHSLLTAAVTFGLGVASLTYADINVVPGFGAADTSVVRNAQLSGLTPAYGSFDGSSVGFAGWEYFNGTAFTGEAAQYTAGGAGLTALLSHRASGNVGLGGITLDVGGTTYNTRLVTGPYDFTINGSASEQIGSLTLQIKHSPFLDADYNAQAAFTPVLTFGGSTYNATTTVKNAQNGGFSDPGSTVLTHVYNYTWENVNIAAFEAFSLDFSSLADQLGFGFSLDTVALHVNAVPEPSTYAAIFAAAMLGVVALRRHRRAR